MQFRAILLSLALTVGLVAAVTPNNVKRDDAVETGVAAITETFDNLIQGIDEAAAEGLSEEEIAANKEALKQIYDQIVAVVSEEVASEQA